MKIILFEDSSVQNLYPITLTHPAFDIRCGGLTLFEALEAIFPEAPRDFYVRPELEKIVERDFKPANAAEGKVLFINASLAPDIAKIEKIKYHTENEDGFVIKDGDRIAALYSSNLDLYVRLSLETIETFLKDQKVDESNITIELLDDLSDVIIKNHKLLESNMTRLQEHYKKNSDGVFVGNAVTIKENVVLDTSDGPIVLSDGVVIEPFVELRGPLYIGKDSIVRSFSKIYKSAIGPVCRIGGEVVECSIQSYTNKQHEGFLGNSYVGSWVNIGGGTSNSDLKNTYSNVKMAGNQTEYQHLGCVIADYVKTSINTSIFTGKVIGVASMLYGFVTKDVPSFTNSVFNEKMVELPLTIAQQVQQAARDRREVITDDSDRDILSSAFEKTVEERKVAKVKKGKLEL